MIGVEALYNQETRTLPPADRLRLLALIAQDLAHAPAQETLHITSLRGLGKEIWQGVDAQNYIDSLRNEWDSPV